MRFPVVLFDLDGTLIDSGPIILASMRHATRTVLGREIAHEELAATVGGQGLVSQMRALDPDRVDELVEVYKEHNDPLHETLEAFEGFLDVLRASERKGAGSASSPRSAIARGSRSTASPSSPSSSRSWSGTRTPTATSPRRTRARRADRLEASAGDAAYVGDSPFDIQAAKAAGTFSVAVAWGGIHPDERLLEEEPDAFVRTPSELLDVL
jgi:pyrophosphatase PpaX